VVQHLAPDHRSILNDLVKRYAGMQVFQVEDGVVVKPDCVYIIPPNRDMVLLDGKLHLLNPEVRVVLASGYSGEDVAARFAGKGLDGLLQKPYTIAKLRETLAGLPPKRLDGEG
jgi:chemotaxis response regulator CheB